MSSDWRVERRGATPVVLNPDDQEDTACGRFLDRLLLRGLSINTLEAYAYDLVLLQRWLEADHLQLDGLNSEHLHRFLAWERGRDSSPKSINRRLHTLRLFYRQVTERELPGSTVARTGRRTRPDHEFGLQRVQLSDRRHLRVKEPKTIVEPLTIEQVNELLTNLRRYRDLGIAHLMLLCGLRSQEVLNLRISDVDANDRRLRIRGKGGKERSVPIPTLLVNLLSAAAAAPPIDPHQLLQDAIRWVGKHLCAGRTERHARLLIRRLEAARDELADLQHQAAC
jgi:site-specific recombinase XerD